jgi:hypothetical protein
MPDNFKAIGWSYEWFDGDQWHESENLYVTRSFIAGMVKKSALKHRIFRVYRRTA